jgi:hypothetical protein
MVVGLRTGGGDVRLERTDRPILRSAAGTPEAQAVLVLLCESILLNKSVLLLNCSTTLGQSSLEGR